MPMRILAGRVQFMMMVRMLDRGDPQAATSQLSDEITDQRCFSGILSANNVDSPRRCHGFELLFLLDGTVFFTES